MISFMEYMARLVSLFKIIDMPVLSRRRDPHSRRMKRNPGHSGNARGVAKAIALRRRREEIAQESRRVNRKAA